MLPVRTSLLASALALLSLSGAESLAAGPARGNFVAPAGVTRLAPGPQRQALRGHAVAHRHRHAADGRRFGIRPWRAHAHGRGAYLPGLYGYGPGYGDGVGDRTVLLREALPEPRDPHAFENLPTRTGIPYPPTPNPTLYRIEGPRDRPITRVIRIADAQTPGSRRSRFVHSETGALLLTVPRR
jgi:hypothetical protein